MTICWYRFRMKIIIVFFFLYINTARTVFKNKKSLTRYILSQKREIIPIFLPLIYTRQLAAAVHRHDKSLCNISCPYINIILVKRQIIVNVYKNTDFRLFCIRYFFTRRFTFYFYLTNEVIIIIINPFYGLKKKNVKYPETGYIYKIYVILRIFKSFDKLKLFGIYIYKSDG